ncbi:MAG: DUF6377 domain-containing protein [Dysgonamonadaceae bacterium]|jgi:hypothetical protein|nr:DUF6377 domain-containing protein [Dysgonamonadaceae bacterium]
MNKFATCLVLALVITHQALARSENDSIFQILEYVLNHKEAYRLEKEKQIEEKKKMLNIPDLTLHQRYAINRQIYAEYKAYQTDSALLYLKNNLTIARRLQNETCVYETQLDLSYLYWQSGKFFESIQNLESLDRSRFDYLSEELLRNYYEAYKQLYRYYANAQADRHNEYYELSNLYRDSLLQIAPSGSKQRQILTAEKLTDENRLSEAEKILLDLLAQSAEETHERAIFANILATIYQKEGHPEMQKKFYAVSAICDIKNAIKENTSTHALALILYQEGDIDRAYRYIQSSINDAAFCNARFRTYEITKIFPIIDSAYQAKAMKQKQELKLYVLLASILLIFLLLAVIYVYRQMRRIARIRKELYHTNLKLQKLNADLQTTNTQLHDLNSELLHVNRQMSETNRVKEAYLGKFIDLCSNYIEKLDNYRRSLNRIANAGKVEELYAMLKSTKYIDNELREFYDHFDETFLRLYPTFIEDFNALFPEEEKQTVKGGELLNTELRIYALIRLGINDNAKIALFLRCSIATIYTYRSRMKNKSFFKDSLEEQILKIG